MMPRASFGLDFQGSIQILQQKGEFDTFSMSCFSPPKTVCTERENGVLLEVFPGRDLSLLGPAILSCKESSIY